MPELDTEGIAAFFERSGDPERAARWRLIHSDAGDYLRRRAAVCHHRRESEVKVPGEQISAFLDRALAILDRVEQDGRWERTDEWRISTPGTERLERVAQDRYRAFANSHGDFSADFGSATAALEAMDVFSHVQHDLFYAIGWSSWAGRRRLDPDDPEPTELPSRAGEYPYLVRISTEARAEAPELVRRGDDWNASDVFPPIEAPEQVDGPPSFGPVPLTVRIDVVEGDPEIEPGPFYRFSVTAASMSMESHAPTLERAAEFVGVYARLQRALAAILDWRWL